jgi:hypothetical protein
MRILLGTLLTENNRIGFGRNSKPGLEAISNGTSRTSRKRIHPYKQSPTGGRLFL